MLQSKKRENQCKTIWTATILLLCGRYWQPSGPFSAWIRTGLAGVGGGLAVARLLIFKNYQDLFVAHLIGALLVMWGAGIFIYAIIDYRRTCTRLMQEALPKNSLGIFLLITAVLLIVAAVVFWITLQ